MIPSPPSLAKAVHLCVDMQRLFAEATPWQVKGLEGLIPNIRRITEARRGRTIFARFLIPASAEAAKGNWQPYYRHWSDIVDAAAADPDLVDLVPDLRDLAAQEGILDKTTYSMFTPPGLTENLAARGAETVIITGAETDICVLATIFDAVERGLHVICVSDAVASSSVPAHEAALSLILPRMSEQITIMQTDQLLSRLAKVSGR
ncbi:MAG: isochorismatase family cysteine hydrolase [Pseudorhodobacter sp.]